MNFIPIRAYYFDFQIYKLQSFNWLCLFVLSTCNWLNQAPETTSFYLVHTKLITQKESTLRMKER